jgi:hypothetical protein
MLGKNCTLNVLLSGEIDAPENEYFMLHEAASNASANAPKHRRKKEDFKISDFINLINIVFSIR